MTAPHPAPTTVPGDWYANVAFSRPQRLVLCVSEQTRLPVGLPLKPAAMLALRLPADVGAVRLALGSSSRTREHAVRAGQIFGLHWSPAYLVRRWLLSGPQ